MEPKRDSQLLNYGAKNLLQCLIGGHIPTKGLFLMKCAEPTDKNHLLNRGPSIYENNFLLYVLLFVLGHYTDGGLLS